MWLQQQVTQDSALMVILERYGVPLFILLLLLYGTYRITKELIWPTVRERIERGDALLDQAHHQIQELVKHSTEIDRVTLETMQNLARAVDGIGQDQKAIKSVVEENRQRLAKIEDHSHALSEKVELMRQIQEQMEQNRKREPERVALRIVQELQRIGKG